MWRHVILMVMCGLWYVLGCLSCDHCSGLPVMSSTCLHLYRAKDILTVRCLLLREKWHKSCPDKKCSAWVVIERVVKEMHGLPHPSLLLMYPCATQARGWCGSDTVELYLSLVCVVGLLLCFLWAPWTATCWKTCSCSPGGWPLSNLSVLQQLPYCKVCEFQPVPNVEQVANSLLQLCKQTQIESTNMNVLQLFTEVGVDQGITL